MDLATRRWPNEPRERLLARILCGEVWWRGERLRDPRTILPQGCDPAELTWSGPTLASRGGLKLEAALRAWSWSVQGKVVLDVGAATGGFTDALLRSGAAQVVAVDAARGLLSPRLVQDPRVKNLEGTNLWSLPTLDPSPHGAVVDVSFRSVESVIPYLLSRVSEGWVIALVKPQFEYASHYPADRGFRGVLDPLVARMVCVKLFDRLRAGGVQAERVLPSPVRGRKGNQEYLVLFQWSKER